MVVTKTVKICYKHPDYAARILIVQVLEGIALGNFTVYTEVNTLIFVFFIFLAHISRAAVGMGTEKVILVGSFKRQPD